MGLNCKKDDLAVIVRSIAGNEGKIVRCVAMAGAWEALDGSGARWITDPPMRGLLGEPAYPVADCNLRPLRDNDGEDEVLRLVGRPVGTPQAA